jgi:DNA-binding beta-propeller fold protein YncE
MGLFRASMTALALGALGSSVQAATLFLGAYPHAVIAVNEATGAVTDSINLVTGVPRLMVLSHDKSKIFVQTEQNGLEVIDVATHKVLTHFDLNTPKAAEDLAFATRRSRVATHYRYSGSFAVDPTGRYVYATLEEIDKDLDHYTVSKLRYAVIDVDQHKIVRWRDVDPEEESVAGGFRTSMAISDDGKYLYLFHSKVAVIDTATLKVIDRIDLAQADDSDDMETDTFGPSLEAIRRPGEFVSLFDSTDPYIHNRLFGIGRFKLATHEFSFTPIGPAPATMAGLEVAPDGKTAYTVVTNGKFFDKVCEFWRFDLPSNTVQGKAEFPCRSRFYFGMSENGQKLYIYGAGYEIDVYDANTLKHERTWNLHQDVTIAGMIQVQ